MSKTLRRVCALLPCVPGLTLLLAGGLAAWLDRPDLHRAGQLWTAGGAVVLAGLVVGAWVAWRLNHPRPLEEDEDEQEPPR